MNDTTTRIRAEQAAPPRPDFTVNQGFTIRAVLPGHPPEPGLLESWWVAAERAEDGEWVTWEAYRLDGEQAGKLGYSSGDYLGGTDPDRNRHDAMTDLARRAGLIPGIARHITADLLESADAKDRAAGRALAARYGPADRVEHGMARRP